MEDESDLRVLEKRDCEKCGESFLTGKDTDYTVCDRDHD